MSLLQELGAQLRATSDELPTGQITVALDRLRTATELLMWVRQQSVDPMGVPQLGNATEHAERAAAALRLTQDTIAGYLSVLGLAADAGAPPDADWKAGLRPDEAEPEPAPGADAPADQLGPWWQQRVRTLTGEDPPPPGEVAAGSAPANTTELLQRVAAGVRSGDRARVGRDLHAVSAHTGLGLSAVTPPVLHRLAGDLLGHEPGPADVERLRSTSAGRVRSMPPGRSGRAGCPARPDLPGAGRGDRRPEPPGRLRGHRRRAHRGAARPAGPRPGGAGRVRPGTAAPRPRPPRRPARGTARAAAGRPRTVPPRSVPP